MSAKHHVALRSLQASVVMLGIACSWPYALPTLRQSIRNPIRCLALHNFKAISSWSWQASNCCQSNAAMRAAELGRSSVTHEGIQCRIRKRPKCTCSGLRLLIFERKDRHDLIAKCGSDLNLGESRTPDKGEGSCSRMPGAFRKLVARACRTASAINARPSCRNHAHGQGGRALPPNARKASRRTQSELGPVAGRR